MLESPAHTNSTDRTSPQVSRRFVVILWAVLVAVVFAQYRNSWYIQPAGDDYGAVAEIQRGNDKGAASFFTHPLHAKNYRPLQSMATWAFGSLAKHPDDRVFYIHILTFGCMPLFIATVLLWAREMPLSKLGVVTSGCVAAFHPVMAGQLAGLDTWSSVLAPTMAWFGAWIVYRFRDRLGPGIALAMPVFIPAVLIKEYSFALAPLGAWVVLWFAAKNRWRGAILTGLAFTLVVCAAMAVRWLTVPDDAGTDSRLPSLGPQYLPYNLGLLGAALMLPLNTVWVYTHRAEWQTLAWAAAGGALTSLTLLTGLWIRARSQERPAGAPLVSTPLGWMVFLVVGSLAATFPNNLLSDISEVYTTAPLVTLALLCGLAADGFATLSKPSRVVFAVVGIAWLAASMVITESKINGVRECGRVAQLQIRQILSFLAPNATDKRIALVYFRDQLEPRRLYSVYQMDDDVPAFDPTVLDWERPHANLRTQSFIVESLDELDPGRFDLVLVWDANMQVYTKLDGKQTGPSGHPGQGAP